VTGGMRKNALVRQTVTRRSVVDFVFRTSPDPIPARSHAASFSISISSSAIHPSRVISWLGPELLITLRHSAAILQILPSCNNNWLEMVKEFTGSLGFYPEKTVVREALAERHRAVASAIRSIG